MVNILDNQTVVVIGGTSGIGFEVAKHVLETTKANVVVASSKDERVQKAVSSLKSLGKDRVRGYVLDVSDSANLEKAVNDFYEKIGTINHLVYTAGDPGFEFMTMEQHEQARAEKIFKIRYWSMLECVKLVKSRMPQSRESSITFTSSTADVRPSAGWILVGTGVTGALKAMARGLAIELAPVRVNCVSPGIVDTSLWDWALPDIKPAVYKQYEEKSPSKSVGYPDEIAEAYGYCIRCKHVTGTSLTVDGGATLA